MTDKGNTGVADVDGSEMKLFERPVDLPELVVLVDGKSGKEIGFVKREQVMGLLETDPRYTGFEDGCTGKFMMAYDPEGAKKKSIVLETDDVIRFLKAIEDHIDTAMAADDVKKMRLGVSYEDHSKMYVLSIHIRYVSGAKRYLSESVVDAIENKGAILESATDRLIELIRRDKA